MDINCGIVDQQLSALLTKLKPELSALLGPSVDDHRLKSACFAVLCLQQLLQIDETAALDSLTEGTNDIGIDAVHVGDVLDGEFVTTIIQAKYSKNLEGKDGYPANAITRIISTIGSIFDPDKNLSVNPLLETKIAEVRSLILDGNVPEVRVLLCNNGKAWEANGQAEIDVSGLTKKRVSFLHVNHDSLIELLQRRKSIDAQFKLSGKAIVEDFDYRRVLVGKLPVSEIKKLFDKHGDTLLDRNIRRYLGLRGNRVNAGIYATLVDPTRRTNFYFFNNGLTATCEKFNYNALQSENWELNISGLQIVNGGQTSKTIQHALALNDGMDVSKTFVLLRLYEISSKEDELVNNITFATNSQNPVDLTDLHSNDTVQDRLVVGLRDLGFEYKRKRDDQVAGTGDIITSSVAAESVMAVWRRRPNAAKFRRSKLFSDEYVEIFSEDLQSAHVVLSVLAFRLVENERKRPSKQRPKFVPYASHFLAMVVMDLLLSDAKLDRTDITHVELPKLRRSFEDNKEWLYDAAVKRVRSALASLGINNATPLPRIAAQFRRGDLLEPLQRELALTRRAPKSKTAGRKARRRGRKGKR